MFIMFIMLRMFVMFIMFKMFMMFILFNRPSSGSLLLYFSCRHVCSCIFSEILSHPKGWHQDHCFALQTNNVVTRFNRCHLLVWTLLIYKIVHCFGCFSHSNSALLGGVIAHRPGKILNKKVFITLA